MRLTPLSTPAYTSPRLASHQASSPSAEASKPDAFTPSLRQQRQGFTVAGIEAEVLPRLEQHINEAQALLNRQNLEKFWSGTLKSRLLDWQQTQKTLQDAIVGKDKGDRIEIKGLKFPDFNFQNMDLSEGYLEQADLIRADFTGANLSKANLKNTNLVGALLNRANLRLADLFQANMYKASLKRAQLQGANMERAYLWGANLSEANLRGAILKLASLEKAWLSYIKAQHTNFEGANVGKALFETPLFFNTNFKDTRGLSAESFGSK